MDQTKKTDPKRITVLYPFPPERFDQKGNKKLRVAAYCRVSSGSFEQLTSYYAQVKHYQQYIHSQPEYESAGVFADEGLSGTGIKKREEFIKMMQAARDGKIDMIITKSLSRFGRNTLDCLENLREL